MVIILKVILALMSIAIFFVARYTFIDFKKSKGSENYDDSSIWEKTIFSSAFFLIFTALISLFIFFMYFIFSKIQIG